ncbi:MAG: DnaB-like helicase C-terminal domain-containing protein [Clostridia bacterium]|nr:DnaB-like helicase C-terminal domain-containing protein [Clostridia bacterium]
MPIEFDTIYKEKSPEEILSLLWDTVQSAVSDQYGNTPDSEITERVRQEWNAMERSNSVLDVAALFELTLWLKENNIPYMVRGCGGSSFILFLLGVTFGNPMPPHYHCPHCHTIHWATNHLDGFDLPQGKVCERDGRQLTSDGHNIPWQTLFGYGEYIPVFDIDLPAYLYDDFVSAVETHWLNKYKSDTEHDMPNDTSKISKHFFNLNFIFLLDNVLIHKSFHTKALNVSCVELALNAWQTLLKYTEYYKEHYDDEVMPPPDSFADLISLFGIMHSTGTWDEAASAMNLYLDYSLSDMIAFRDDVYHYLLAHNFLEKDAWREMNRVRMGNNLRAVTDEMKISRDKWVLNRCERIAYLFPKSHAVEYILFWLKAMVLPETEHGLTTGYSELDRSLSGIDKTDVILLGGRPAMGKTQLSLGIAKHIAANGDKKIIVFTEPKETARWMKIPTVTIYAGNPMSIDTIRDKIRTTDFDLAIIDTLQLVKEFDNKAKWLMREIKVIAKETETPIMLTSNLSRRIERRNDHIPRLEDIPNYRNVEPYTDRIYFLYREAYYTYDADRSEAWLFSIKNVRGNIGESLLTINWDDEYE